MRIIGIVCMLFLASTARADVTLVRDGQAMATIVVDATGSTGTGPKVLGDAAQWFADSIARSSGARLPIVDKPGATSTLVIARAEAYPKIAAAAGLKNGYDAYCIITRPNRVYVLGNSEAASAHGIAELLRGLGFRWFAPSPRWHHVPKLRQVVINTNATRSPALIDRRIWYAYGMSGDDLKPLNDNYRRWALANRLSVGTIIQTGHSYGNIIARNKEAFEKHPEFYALLENGKRDNQGAVNARKFCFSNPGLIQLAIEDRIRLLETNRKANPAAFMVSMDPSDGQGTCHCEDCKKLGTTTDRVLHLANQVARGLKQKHADAWVGLYAYSSHRLPPTIEVEPNVYVQVAMGFNRTNYTLPELIELWSRKVGAIGLREYYGVEAWDWGLPGRMRGARVDYHRKWIPFYAKRKLNAINAETNANWGAQTLGLQVAAQLMWNPDGDVDQLTNEFFSLCFDDVAPIMRKLYAKFDESPPLRASTLLPMFDDVNDAWQKTNNDKVKERLADLMAYLVYVAKFREFDLIRNRRPERDDEYYRALLPLMRYAWRIRHRDMVHYYALARRLCNGLPLQDKRPEFYLANRDRPPIWQQGTPPQDDEVYALFRKSREALASDGDPTVVFSRYLEPIRLKGKPKKGSRILADEREGVARFRKGLFGYLVPAQRQTVRLRVIPNSRQVKLSVFSRGTTTLYEKTFRKRENGAKGDSAKGDDTMGYEAVIELPRANEYRVEITGDFELQVPPDAPFVFEASASHPAWIEYSGPHYFYVPRGCGQILLDAGPRLSLHLPGQEKRLDITPAQRIPGKDYAVVKVPANAAGKVWQTSSQTRGRVTLLNVPPLLSFYADQLFVPREVAESDGLTTQP